jgi:hypothetical protein
MIAAYCAHVSLGSRRNSHQSISSISACWSLSNLQFLGPPIVPLCKLGSAAFSDQYLHADECNLASRRGVPHKFARLAHRRHDLAIGNTSSRQPRHILDGATIVLLWANCRMHRLQTSKKGAEITILAAIAQQITEKPKAEQKWLPSNLGANHRRKLK